MNEENDAKIQNLLIQYKLYVQMADKINQRREGANRFYVTIITSPGLLLLIATQINPNANLPIFMPIFIGIIGIMMSLFWYASIKSHKEVINIKMNIIRDVEKCLPHQGFTTEYHELNCNVHAQITRAEMAIPWLATASYALLIFFSTYQYT